MKDLRVLRTKIQNFCTARACIPSLLKDGSLVRFAVSGRIVAVQEWKISMTKLSISARFVKITMIKHSIPRLTQGGTPSCPVGGARWVKLVFFLDNISNKKKYIFLF